MDIGATHAKWGTVELLCNVHPWDDFKVCTTWLVGKTPKASYKLLIPGNGRMI